MCGRSRVNVRVEPLSTFAFTQRPPYFNLKIDSLFHGLRTRKKFTLSIEKPVDPEAASKALLMVFMINRACGERVYLML